jgi:two-component system LytT family response regulator
MLRVLIVDDESPARSRLKKLLSPLAAEGRIEVAAEAADGIQALEILGRDDLDLIFLDIRMPELDGFGVLERIDPSRRPFVVFTTAFDEYAIKAFSVNAVDYLLKPISKERLLESVERVEKLRSGADGQAVSDERLSRLMDWIDAQSDARTATESSGSKDFVSQLSVPYRDRILIVPIERLISIEISEGITRLFVIEDGEAGLKPRLRQHIVSYTLEQLEQRLDPAAFMRVHRSAIVQVQHIKEMISWFSGRYKLVLTGDHEVIASRERSKVLRDRLSL